MKLKKNVALSDSGFLFNPSTGDSYSVNPIGMEMLGLIKEGKEDAEIIQIITKEYMIDNDTVEKDLYDFKIILSNYKLAE
jgi:hypothetical protein